LSGGGGFRRFISVARTPLAFGSLHARERARFFRFRGGHFLRIKRVVLLTYRRISIFTGVVFNALIISGTFSSFSPTSRREFISSFFFLAPGYAKCPFFSLGVQRSSFLLFFATAV